jgi:outer membrane protein OmpA-like peptidoglycan-associated protein
MRNRTNRHALSLLLLVLLTPPLAAQDIPNSQDHPLISRYPGQTIRAYDVKEFDQYNLVLSVNRTGAPEKIDKLEGKVTRITYRNPAGRSTAEIFRNFEDALKAAGAQIFFSCAGRDCGTPIRWTPVNGIRDMGGLIQNRYAAAKVKKAGAETFVSVFVGGQSTQVDVIEPKPVETGLVTVNADAMAAGIDAEGHIAIYSILFDTGRSTLKPESRAVIAEIAKLLNNRPTLKLFVVGHTDGSGGLESNMKLSRDRAAAVTQSLTSDHGIAAARLSAQGVGPLSPVASNGTEEGRAKNRRVDLVAQ